ncbi:hypothetical protein HID58_065593, partial [Brassica napus]
HLWHIAIIPSPGVGHLIPLAEFAKRLVDHHRFTVTFIFPGESSPSSSQRSILNSLPSSITSVYVHPVDLSDLPSTAGIETRISLTVTRSNPALRELSRRFSSSIYLAPMRSTWPMSSTCRPYIFLPIKRQCLVVFASLARNVVVDLTEPIKIPGCVPITGKDLSEPCQVRSDDTYKWLLHNAKRFREAEGILLNSFVDLKPNAIKALQEPAPDKPPVGPLVNTGSSYANGKDECESVELSRVSQLNELALGLAESGKQFIWSNRSIATRILGPNKGKRLSGSFMGSTGSTLESIVNGVPLIAWPLYAEQKTNASLLVEDVER